MKQQQKHARLRVFLVRHAESDHDPKYNTDAERPLNSMGWDEIRIMAKQFSDYGIRFAEAWTSPFVRALETYAAILDVYNIDSELIEHQKFEDLAVHGDPRIMTKKIEEFFRKRTFPDKYTILLVGHNPNISTIFRILCSRKARRLKTSEGALLESYVVNEGKNQTIRWNLIKFFKE